jgi:hypothetical protein
LKSFIHIYALQVPQILFPDATDPSPESDKPDLDGQTNRHLNVHPAKNQSQIIAMQWCNMYKQVLPQLNPSPMI